MPTRAGLYSPNGVRLIIIIIIIPIIAGYNGRKDLVLHANNYIVYEYPTI